MAIAASIAPHTMAISAALNTAKRTNSGLMKSVTAPYAMRSYRLPSPPPTIIHMPMRADLGSESGFAISQKISAAMISGNSILFSSRSQIKGLTTSAGLWTSAIFGLTIGAGLYTVALIVFIALVACLSFYPVLEKYLKDRSNHFEIHLELKNRSNLQDFVSTIRRLGLRIDDIESNHAYLNSGLSVYSISMTIQSPELKKYKEHSEIIEALRSLEYVSHIEEMS